MAPRAPLGAPPLGNAAAKKKGKISAWEATMQRRMVGIVAGVLALGACMDVMLMMCGALAGGAAMPVWPLHVRQQAGANYSQLQQEYGMFPGVKPPCGTPAERGHFCLGWVWHLFTTYAIADKARSGRPRKVTDALARKAAAAIVQATKQKQFGASRTMNSACNRIPAVMAVLLKSGATPKTLWRHIRRGKLVRQSTVNFKKPLSKQLQDDRLRTSEEWLRKGVYHNAPGVVRWLASGDMLFNKVPIPPNRLTNLHEYRNGPWLKPWAADIVWIDAKKIYICPKTFKVWGDGTTLTMDDARVLNSNTLVLHYYSAVSARHGGILLKFVSGTKGKGYKAPNGGYMVGGAGVVRLMGAVGSWAHMS